MVDRRTFGREVDSEAYAGGTFFNPPGDTIGYAVWYTRPVQHRICDAEEADRTDEGWIDRLRRLVRRHSDQDGRSMRKVCVHALCVLVDDEFPWECLNLPFLVTLGENVNGNGNQVHGSHKRRCAACEARMLVNSSAITRETCRSGPRHLTRVHAGKGSTEETPSGWIATPGDRAGRLRSRWDAEEREDVTGRHVESVAMSDSSFLQRQSRRRGNGG